MVEFFNLLNSLNRISVIFSISNLVNPKLIKFVDIKKNRIFFNYFGFNSI
jgi:hypothetical protein